MRDMKKQNSKCVETHEDVELAAKLVRAGRTNDISVCAAADRARLDPEEVWSSVCQLTTLVSDPRERARMRRMLRLAEELACQTRAPAKARRVRARTDENAPPGPPPAVGRLRRRGRVEDRP